jgi:hypothetical protein
MDDFIALGAIRRLSADVGNTVGQLALAQSGIEHLKMVAQGVEPDTWDKIMGEDDTGHPEMHVTLRGEQLDAVMRLLAAVDGLG